MAAPQLFRGAFFAKWSNNEKLPKYGTFGEIHDDSNVARFSPCSLHFYVEAKEKSDVSKKV